MNRRNVILGLILVMLVAVVVALVQRSLSGPPANRLLVAGDVRAVTRTVSAPTIAYPTMSYTVKVLSYSKTARDTIQLVENLTTAGRFSLVTSPTIAVIPTQTAGQPVISGKLTSVDVRVGDHVTTGTVIAQLDTRLLDLGVQAAKLQAQNTHTNVAVLNARLDDLADAQGTLDTAQSTAFSTAYAAIDAAIQAQLQTSLYGPHAEAVKGLPALAAAVMGLQQQLSHLTPGTPEYLAVAGKLQKLMPTYMKAKYFVEHWNTIRTTALAKVAVARATARSKAGTAISAAIGKAQDQLDDAKAQIRNARQVLTVIRDGSDLGVGLAEFKRGQATITSPISGYVTQAATARTVAVVGAPLFVITPDEPELIDTYLTADELARVHVGSEADITFDSSGGKTYHATLRTIGSDAPYPPTSFPTDIVHMTHAVKATFQLDSGTGPPAGTPVDIAIHTD